MKVAAVIPTYRASATIADVVNSASKFTDLVIVVDDSCPEQSWKFVPESSAPVVLRRETNGGVGAAAKAGIEEALRRGFDIIVKLDADGQMDATLVPELIQPLKEGASDFSKGTRFDSPEDLEGMPRTRLFGNSVLSLVNKITSGYWSVNDPTNGFIAFSKRFGEQIKWEKIDDGYFFESDLLFRARLVGARITQMRMRARYAGEKSSLKPLKQVLPFTWKHFRNQIKRFAYMYFIREWNLGTIYVFAGVISLATGLLASLSAINQAQIGSVGSGTAVLASLGFILWVQFSTAFLTVDVSSEPR